MKNGQIGVTTENIFPVIKKFLYSDQEIFLRELVSNAIDASQKLKTIAFSDSASVPDFKEEDLRVSIALDEENGTLTISDYGIGMTEEEVVKYIADIAFSGASEFLSKYNTDNAGNIIGHFGLGFYSSFMVADKVEIVTRSYKEGSKTVKWTCTGDPEYTIEEVEDRVSRGTDIILYLSSDAKEEFGKKSRIKELLNKYCKYLPVPIAFGKKTKWDSEQQKQVDTEEDDIINSEEPLWRKHPTELKDEDYKKFFRSLYPGQPEPLFWIHLNVSEPFELTGILFMPPTAQVNYIIKKNTINLYCNNVFVTDQVEGIVPDFLQLLYGVIDSPDIPLNVSRSYLQSDRNVKKISGYIEKKVSQRLNTLFKEDRKKFEELWGDMRLFVNYGIVSEDDFYDRAKDFYLFKDVDGKFFTFDEYKALIETEQKNKNDQLIYLYATDTLEQGAYIDACKNKGYSVLLLDNQLDILTIEHFERKFEKSKFSRVDSTTINKLIDKGEESDLKDDEDDVAVLRAMFSSQLRGIENKNFNVMTEHMGEDVLPIVVSVNEWSSRQKANRRFQTMIWGSSGDSYTVTLNTDHELVNQLWKESLDELKDTLKPLNDDIVAAKKELDEFSEKMKDVKYEDRTDDDNKKENELWEKQQKARNSREDAVAEYAKDNVVVKELIEVALLSAGLLNGQQLADFIKRTVSLIDVKSPKAKKKCKKCAAKKEPEVVETEEVETTEKYVVE